MSCVHLRRLYQLCEDEDIKLGGADLLQIVCTQCGVKETCPSMLMEEFEPDEPVQEDQDSGKRFSRPE